MGGGGGGGQIDPPPSQKRLPSKSPALLGLNSYNDDGQCILTENDKKILNTLA